jgi:hypothetical protein
MLRITRVTECNRGATLKLEGKLTGPWVGELRRACGQPPGPYALDLAALSFADGDGVRLLRELLAAGSTLAACSGLVAELLRAEDR